MFLRWLHAISILCLLAGFASTAWILQVILRHPQRMAVMNVVWPVTALFGTVVVVCGYRHYGRKNAIAGGAGQARCESDPDASISFAAVVGKGTLHCGAGCMIGDVLAEWLAFLVPTVAIWFGWHGLFADKMYAVWILGFVFAFVIGIVFQYYAIVPMRGLSPGKGIVAALKADTLSLASWQVGMYGFMAFAQLYLYQQLLGLRAEVDTPEFWFAMQLAMISGFLTAYPVNWWLIKTGIKEKM